MANESGHTSAEWAYEVEESGEYEKQEVFMVLVAQAVVNISTMMVELLDASFAKHAVESASWLYDVAIETEILEVDVVIIGYH